MASNADREEFQRLQAIRMAARGATPEEIAVTLGIGLVQARIIWTTHAAPRRGPQK